MALKVLHPGAASNPQSRRRFMVEAEAVAALDHPGIVPLFEVAEYDHQLCLAMGLMAGGTLAEVGPPAPDSPGELAAFFGRIARAVEHAHQRGVVHRDLKPSNILLDDRGEPALADFGLAKLPGKECLELTLPTHVLGTPAYMAPEVAVGGAKSATAVADIYSLGAILYEALAGHAPFVGESIPALLKQIAEAEVPALPRWAPRHHPSTRDVLQRRDVELICLRCLRRDPGHRYASATELAQDLERVARAESITLRTPTLRESALSWARRNRLFASVVLATSLALLLGLAGTLSQLVRAQKLLGQLQQAVIRLELEHIDVEPHQLHKEEALLALAKLRWNHPDSPLVAGRLWSALCQHPRAYPLTPPMSCGGNMVGVAFAADGRFLLTTSYGGPPDDPGVHIWDCIDGRHVRRFPHDSSFGVLHLNDEVTRLLTVTTQRQVSLWDLHTGSPMQGEWSDLPDVTAACLTTDGNRVVVLSAPNTLQAWDVSSGQLLWRRPKPNRGKVLAASRDLVVAIGTDEDVEVLATRDGSVRWRMSDAPRPIHAASFSSDDRWLFILAAESAMLTATTQVSGRSTSLHFERPIEAAAFHPDGKSLLVSTRDHHMLRIDLHGSSPMVTETNPTPCEISSIRFSPDGKWVATGGVDGRVRIHSAPGEPLASLEAFHGLFVNDCVFSAEGTLLATSSDDHSAMLWKLETPPFVHIESSRDEHARFAALAPTATRYAAALDDGTVTVCTFPGTKAEQTLPSNGRDVRRLWFSHSGRWLIAADNQGGARLLRADRPGGQAIALQHPARLMPAYAFNPSENWLALATTEGGHLWQLLPTSAKEGVRLPCATPLDLAFSPDGRRLAIAVSTYEIELFDTSTWQRIRGTRKHAGPVTGLKFDPDGRHLATFGQDRTVRLWDASTGAPVGAPWEHPSEVTCISIDRQRREWLTGQRDGTVMTWKPTGAGGEGKVLFRADTAVASLQHSPDGRWLLVDLGSAVSLRDAGTGLPVMEPLVVPDGRGAGFSPDGHHIVRHGVKQVLMYRMPLADIPSDAVLDAITQLSLNRKLGPDGSVGPLNGTQLDSLWASAGPLIRSNAPSRGFDLRLGRP